MVRILVRFICGAVVSLVYLIGACWAAGALYFDLPLPGWTRDLVAVIWMLAAFALPILLRPRWHGILIDVSGLRLHCDMVVDDRAADRIGIGNRKSQSLPTPT